MSELPTAEKDAGLMSVLSEHTAAGFFHTADGHAECYCGHVLGDGETYPAHVAAALAAAGVIVTRGSL